MKVKMWEKEFSIFSRLSQLHDVIQENVWFACGLNS